MTTAEIAPAPRQTTPELSAERLPHLAIPGFDKLRPERQEFFASIPADKFNLVQPVLEKEIAAASETSETIDQSETKRSQGRKIETDSGNRETQANTAIDTYHRAANGDPEAKKDLLDAKKELLGEEPSDDEIFQTILENKSGNPFAQDTVLEVMLTDTEAQAHQDVLDLFKEFRDDLASVDDAIKPAQQIDLFIELTKGGGSLPNRMFLARKALTTLTDSGRRNLFEGLTAMRVLVGGEISEDGVDKLRELAGRSDVTPAYA